MKALRLQGRGQGQMAHLQPTLGKITRSVCRVGHLPLVLQPLPRRHRLHP